jgi:hypothetical protein
MGWKTYDHVLVLIFLACAFTLSLLVSISLPSLPALDIVRTTFNDGTVGLQGADGNVGELHVRFSFFPFLCIIYFFILKMGNYIIVRHLVRPYYLAQNKVLYCLVTNGFKGLLCPCERRAHLYRWTGLLRPGFPL